MAALQQQNPEQFQILFDAEVAKRAAQITQELVQSEMQANAAKQDPLVRIKQQEVDLRAMDMQRKAEETNLSKTKKIKELQINLHSIMIDLQHKINNLTKD